MQTNQVTITGEDEEYILVRDGNKYFVNGNEIIQNSLKELDENEKGNYNEQKESGYNKKEALFITNLLRDGPFDDLSDSYLNIVVMEILLLMLNSNNTIYGKNIVYEQEDDEDILIVLKYGNRQVKFDPSESFRDKILELIN